MPQASDELRAAWPGADEQAIRFLVDERGWMLTRRWTFVPPIPKGWGDVDERERSALKYLIHEWDFGGMESVASYRDIENVAEKFWSEVYENANKQI